MNSKYSMEVLNVLNPTLNYQVLDIGRIPIITNVNENVNNNSISIFPNPFSSNTTISFDKKINNSTIKIIDILGKTVQAINFSGQNLIFKKGELKNGIYIIEVIENNQIVGSKKIVVE